MIKAAFPSPITNSSIDSPPNKMNPIHPYMPLPNSPKAYSKLQQQHYDMYNMPGPNFPPSISIPPNNSSNNNHTSTSPSYYNNNNNNASSVPDNGVLSDTLASPTSPGSIEEELVQRK